MRRLHRSSTQKILGGVCGGLGVHMDIDPVIIRIIWVILAFASLGVAVLIYVIMWIIVPPDTEGPWD